MKNASGNECGMLPRQSEMLPRHSSMIDQSLPFIFTQPYRQQDKNTECHSSVPTRSGERKHMHRNLQS